MYNFHILEMKKAKILKRFSCGFIKNSIFVHTKFKISVRPTSEDGEYKVWNEVRVQGRSQNYS